MNEDKQCIIIGASHAGVNCAFALRRQGWKGNIMLLDKDPVRPYHRPPLSKAFLSSDDPIDTYQLKSAESYQKEKIDLKLGVAVNKINREHQNITLDDGSNLAYDKLVLAIGAQPKVPPIPGVQIAQNLFTLRTAYDAVSIRQTLQTTTSKRVVVIGGGYIGLEVAASLKKLGAQVTVIERESRVLARVTAPEMSAFFEELHTRNGVKILKNKHIVAIETSGPENEIQCADGSSFLADLIILGVGIRVNTSLAEQAGLRIENGIRVDRSARTNDENIYAIGDCSFHHNPHYNRMVRLESVQNAVDQAKVAAAAICGKDITYNTIPWFWSDQYDVKLQMVGLSEGYQEAFVRKELDAGHKWSVWYFAQEHLLAVDAINHAKAYMLGTKVLKKGITIDKTKLVDPNTTLKSLLAQ